MSQSEEHRLLVSNVAAVVARRWPDLSLIVDIQLRPGDPQPPVIGGYRPDVYGTDRTGDVVVIAEAETARGLEGRHTSRQLRSFLTHLQQRRNGVMVLAVPGQKGDRAKTILRLLARELRVTRPRLWVFDGLDLWTTASSGGVHWRLA